MTWLEPALAAMAGAIIGSFLTVVAARVPALVLQSPDGWVNPASLLKSLSWPGSRCGHCQAPLSWRDNVPLVSFLLLGGRCRACHAAYGWHYLVLEAATALAAGVTVLLLGWTWQGAMVFGLLAVLLALCAIDFAEMLLPDVLVLPLLPLGLFYQSRYGAGLLEGLAGAAAGFGMLWLIGALYRHSRARDGLGGGDIKLAGALGAWLGLGALPWFLLTAFAAGLVGMGLPILLARKDAAAPVPFGPFLALSAVVFLMWPQLAAMLSGLISG